MMTGFGQFGPLEMGGMFTTVKVRDGIAPGDYKDPGPYKNPDGTVAYEVENPSAAPARKTEAPSSNKPNVEINVVKPGTKGSHMSNH